MPASDFCLKRYDEQMAWYDKKSALYKKLHIASQVTLIILSAITPVLILFQEWDLRSFAIVTSTTVSAIVALAAKFKIHETWIGYRGAAEAMRREYSLYSCHAGDYRGVDDRDQRFIERIEEIIASEHAEWTALKKQK